MRIAFVPVGAPPLDTLVLADERTLASRVVAVLQRHGVIPPHATVDARTTQDGVDVRSTGADGAPGRVLLRDDGTLVVADADSAAPWDGSGTGATAERVRGVVARACAAAPDLWNLMPAGDGSRRVAAMVALSGKRRPRPVGDGVDAFLLAPGLPVVLSCDDLAEPGVGRVCSALTSALLGSAPTV